MITIGPWTILQLKNGNYWIRHEDGEFNRAQLASHIIKFYAENF